MCVMLEIHVHAIEYKPGIGQDLYQKAKQILFQNIVNTFELSPERHALGPF